MGYGNARNLPVKAENPIVDVPQEQRRRQRGMFLGSARPHNNLESTEQGTETC
jgi:hypothetical protein